MKLNFQKLKVPADIAWKETVTIDGREAVANLVLGHGLGIADHALAFKIYRSEGDTDYDEREIGSIRRVLSFGKPLVIEAVTHAIKETENNIKVEEK